MGSSPTDSLIINSLTAIISTVIGAVLGLLGGLWVYEKGRTDRERAKHLTELKNQAFEPMLTYLTNEVIPILEHRLGSVGICQARVSNPNASIMEASVEIEERFCHKVVSPNVAVILSHTDEGEEVPAFFDNPLYRHAHKHFADLFKAWDSLMQQFADYTAECARYADWLRSEFDRTIPLPEPKDMQQFRWARKNRLALLTLYRQLGIWSFPPSRSQRGDHLEELNYGGQALVNGTADEVQQVITTLDEMKGQRDGVDRLMERAAPIRDYALKVKARIEEHLHGQRLPGRCEYLA